ncbi:MAG: bifunctional UDP-N-acetylglucosamine diphosphorylase/glucosamine-1-phosphate N-acetyltransferase GlmU, partial [Mariprofundaceae bacterium]|nr:bifunctional UDP-N-acetylglucosamine diphosphorylase/glucosamine-1-phosphate N-acetyltransferase GlmU [Mariprofundaceae bacterium]
ENVIQDVRDVLIVCGDTPLLRSKTLSDLVDAHRAGGASVTVLTAEVEDPFGYGRIKRDKQGKVSAIVEEKDASDAERDICEVSSGIYCVRHADLFDLLHKLGNNNAQGEYYLPDIVPLALADGKNVEALGMQDCSEMLGVNNRAQLSQIEDTMQARIIHDWQMKGVTIEKPDTVRIEATVSLGTDVTIQAGCYLIGSTRIGDGCRVGPYAVLVNAWLDDDVEIFAFSHIHSANVGAESQIGPFGRLRPGTVLGEDVHVGNFVEIKNSVIDRGSKVNHLSYIGDTDMGSQCNIGAGSITCNYDGANKHRTRIGDGVFVGSDTKLIAPVEVQSGATIGAGSI